MGDGSQTRYFVLKIIDRIPHFLAQRATKKADDFPAAASYIQGAEFVSFEVQQSVKSGRKKQRVHETLSLHLQVGGAASQWVRRIRLAYQEIFPKLQIETTFKF